MSGPAEHYVENGGAKLWTAISGRGHAKYIVLCSGGPGCCDYLLPVSMMLEDGYNVIRFEQRGCGRSDRDGKYDLLTAISDLEAIRAYYGIESWIVGGHSWGAALSLIYATLHPERVASFLFIAGIGVQNNKEWYAEFLANREKYGEALPDMLYPFNPEVNHTGNASFRSFIQRPALYRDMSRLTMPALFMYAENDIRPDWPVRQVQALITNAVGVTIPGAAHYIWLTHEREMRLALREFLGLSLT